ncbi:MAG: 3-dehydroquinate synthase family protein [Vicingaceae bacterium]
MKDNLLLLTEKSTSFEEGFGQLNLSGFSRVFVLCDENTHRFCWPILEDVIEKQGISYDLHVEAAGEASKNWRVCLEIWEKLSEAKADRQTLFINLGGGMITDLGAFVASVYKRGIPFIHLPTSLLGMTDAAIGGKCGIDFLHFKNQLGLFAQAESILIYPPFLKTLPTDERRSGFAEVLKHALIADVDYWKELKNINLGDWESLAKNIEPSIQIKSQIVEADPLEKAGRKKLNFGHTVGHALESYFLKNGQPIPHGYAIAAGMFVEAFLSVQYSQLPKADFEDIAQTIRLFYQVLDFTEADLDEILSYLKQDKKNEGGKSRFTLLKSIGNAEINVEVEEADVQKALMIYLQYHGKA